MQFAYTTAPAYAMNVSLPTALFVAALFAGPPPEVPPNVPLIVELEVCILKAELCAANAWQPACGSLDNKALEMCIASYEDCSYDLKGAHNPSCRIDHVWCALEMPFSIDQGLNPDYVAYCEEVDATCPSWQ